MGILLFSFIRDVCVINSFNTMNREYIVFNEDVSYDDIIESLNAIGKTKYYNTLSEDIFSNDLDFHEAIIFEEIKVALIAKEKNQKTNVSIRNISFEVIKEKEIVPEESTQSISRTSDWGIVKTNVNNSTYTGSGVKVAILDTGFDCDHPDYKNRNISRISFISNSNQDDNGHGMHCTGIACGYTDSNKTQYGVAYKSNIYSCKVLDSQQKGYQSDVIRGVFWAIKNNCKVINISYGIQNNGNRPYDIVFERAIKFAFNNSCITIIAIGNDSTRKKKQFKALCSPSDCPTAIAVSAIDKKNIIYEHGNRAYKSLSQNINFTAPGVDIYSSWSRSSPSRLSNAKKTGTSMAASFVTGIIALLWEKHPTAHPQLIINILKKTALNSKNWLFQDVGHGLVQAP
ncbi:MAG: S8 family serine peptidase [Flavobacteriaceae bacterium]|nr:S8 family serine peptidase [Flavobacteriaceae bacterium]